MGHSKPPIWKFIVDKITSVRRCIVDNLDQEPTYRLKYPGPRTKISIFLFFPDRPLNILMLFVFSSDRFVQKFSCILLKFLIIIKGILQNWIELL